MLQILTWNCNGAFRKKYQALDLFDADICIIQECENPETSTDEKYKSWRSNFLWIGENKNKGLGIFAKDRIKLEALKWESNGFNHFLPCIVNNEFNLLAVWCHGANSSTFRYIGQLWKYLEINKSLLANCIIAGDFNSNAIWDKPERSWNHSDVLKELSELNIESQYHKFNKEEQGKESVPTFYLQKNKAKPYHIDYIFVSKFFHEQFNFLTIGKFDDWIKLSDHTPLFIGQ